MLTSAERAIMAADLVSLRDTYPTSVLFSNLLPLADQPDYHAQLGWSEDATKETAEFTLSCVVVPMSQAKMRGLFAAKRRVETPGGDVPMGDLLIEVITADLGANTITDTSFATVLGLTYRVSSVETVGTMLYVYATKTPAIENLDDTTP